MTTLTEFSYQNTNIRTLGTKIEPWFVAVDVLRALEIHTKNITRSLEALDADEKMLVNLATGESYSSQKMVVKSDYHLKTDYETNPIAWIISEPGLYKIIFKSKNPIAKQFTRFVTHEVLPQIRKTGKYIPKKLTLGRGRPIKTYKLSNGETLSIRGLRVRCAEYEGVYVNKSLYKKAPAEVCIEYINDHIARGTRIPPLEIDFGRDETYWILADGKRIEIPK